MRRINLEWVFEKIFDQLSPGKGSGDGLLTTQPFSHIQDRILRSPKILQTIADLLALPIDEIKAYLNSESFLERFLFSKLGRKIPVAILLNRDLIPLLELREITQSDYHLMALNNRKEMMEQAVTKILPGHECLYYCCCRERIELYFWLRQKGLQPNLSVYLEAVQGGSLEIVKDISESIGLTPNILKSAFEAGCHEIIDFLLDRAAAEKVPVAPSLVSYALLNSDTALIEKMKTPLPTSFFHSAVLSGNLEMVRLIEAANPQIHQNLAMDAPGIKKGKKNILAGEISYQKNGKNFFAHTINYAIQSGSAEMIHYLLAKGYGISVSNILTAVRQASLKILQLILDEAPLLRLPHYYWVYFSFCSVVSNKLAKARTLVERGYLSLEPVKYTTESYRILAAHADILKRQTISDDYESHDADYFLNYASFFGGLRVMGLIEQAIAWYQIQNEIQITVENPPLISDLITLIGPNTLMKGITAPPRDEIVAEIVCCGKTFKICSLHQKGYLRHDAMERLVAMLAEPGLTALFERLGIVVQSHHLSLHSGVCRLSQLSYQEWKVALKNCKLADLPQPDPNLVKRLINYCRSEDLMEEALQLEKIKCPD